MGKSLVIVESPAKARTINKYLGSGFVVKSSVGHIRDLPVSGSGTAKTDPKERARQAALTRKMAPEEKAAHRKRKAYEQLVRRMGIEPDKGWDARYEVLPGKEKVVNELRKHAEQAEAVYLATDLDREGEAIAWHLREVIGGEPDRFRRVVFNEITKKAIREAFDEPASLDLDRVNAQQARRFLDRVVGFMVSPLLWERIARGLSAGRVQSVAVRLIVEREREIHKFNPEEYWQVHADLQKAASDTTRFEVTRMDGKAFRPGNKDEADAALAGLRGCAYRVGKREDKPTRSKPGAPFITSTLQQGASTRLGFGVKKTMTLAQRLYEAGHITYMRTDSTNLSGEALESCREYIGARFGQKYLPPEPNTYTSKKGAQEAHEAIRPTNVEVGRDDLQDMDDDARRLYDLIWRQFVACQMVPAEFLSSSIVVEGKTDSGAGFELRARGRIVKFDGFLRVLPLASGKDDDKVLPDLQVDDALKLIELHPSQHFTKPPPRFSEASLVKELEKLGIGRPSTYAAIISTIQERGYVTVRNRRFYAEKLGEIVTDRLVENFSNLLDYGFTAGMEEQLDEIATGRAEWKAVLDKFYKDFRSKLEAASDPDQGMRGNLPTDTDIPCPGCGRNMQIRTASTGVFLGCSAYALPPKERCRSTLNLVPGDEVADADHDDEAEARILRKKHHCQKCDAAMDSFLIDESRKLHICSNNPDCPGYEVESGQFRIKGYDGPTIECDKCGAEMQLKAGRFGKFFGCTSSECKNTRKLLKNGQPAPPKADPVPMPELQCQKVEDHYVLRDGASGIFLAASQFPKHRETRAPLVSELLPHREELDPKYQFLADAPLKDPDGNPSVVRYSRKSKEQYVMSEKDGKATGWTAHYRDGKWEEKRQAKAKPKAKSTRKTKSSS